LTRVPLLDSVMVTGPVNRLGLVSPPSTDVLPLVPPSRMSPLLAATVKVPAPAEIVVPDNWSMLPAALTDREPPPPRKRFGRSIETLAPDDSVRLPVSGKSIVLPGANATPPPVVLAVRSTPLKVEVPLKLMSPLWLSDRLTAKFWV